MSEYARYVKALRGSRGRDHWRGQRKMLAEQLRGEGVPLLDLEREYDTMGSGQIATRVQAFLEML